MNKWLHRNNFSYKKPKGFPYKANKLEQEKFVEEYKELKANLEPEDTIMSVDSCHPSINTKISHGWIRKGKKSIRGNS